MSVRSVSASPRSAAEHGVTINVGSLKITSEVIELRCEIWNDTEEDVWVCVPMPDEYDAAGPRRPGDELFVDRDDQTLVILRRMNRPYRGYVSQHIGARYARLRAGQKRPETLSIRLPVTDSGQLAESLPRAVGRRVEGVRRLVFEIGYYTTKNLKSHNRHPGPFDKIRFDESESYVVICDTTQGRVYGDEEAVRMTISGVHIPYKEWLSQVSETTHPQHSALLLMQLARVLREGGFLGNPVYVEEYEYAKHLFAADRRLFDDSARQIAEVYTQVAEGTVNPEELLERLNGVMGRSQRETLLNDLFRRARTGDSLEVARPTTQQRLRDLFYNFCLDLEQYRYAQQLFGIKDLPEGPPRQIADVYVQVAEGKVNPAELPQHLDRILSKSEREKLLDELLRKRGGTLVPKPIPRTAGEKLGN